MLVLLAMGAGGGLWWVMERDIPLPEWARDRIDARLAEAIPDAQVSFGEVVLVLDEGWRPRGRVQDLRVSTPEGAEIVHFNEVRASLSMRGLLRGQLELQSLDLNGVFLTLRRLPTGALELSGGTGLAAASRAAPNLAQLVADLNAVLLRPGLTRLVRADLRGLTVRYEDQRAGRSWTIDGGHLSLARGGEDVQIRADLTVLGGRAEAALITAGYAGRIGAQASEFGASISGVEAGDIAVQGPAFSWLGALRAPISGSLRGAMNAEGQFEPFDASFQIGAGVIQPTPQARAIPIEQAESSFSYDPAARFLRFDTLSVVSKWVSGRLKGTATLADDDQGGVSDLVGQLRLSDLVINPAELYDVPVELAQAELDFRLTPQPFSFELGRLQVMGDADQLTAEGTLRAGPDGWDIAVDAGMARTTAARVLALWPETVVSKTRAWLGENLRGGVIEDVNAALRWSPGQPPETYLGFDFREADVRFLRQMPRITAGRGHASLLRDRFVLVVDGGTVEAPEGGPVQIAGSSFIVPDIAAKEETPGVLRLRTTSSVTGALSLLNQPPLNIMTKADLPVSLAEGQAALEGTLSLPLVKGVPVEQITFDVTGEIAQVETAKLIPDRPLVSERLALTASDDGVEIAGRGTLDGVPFDVTWSQRLGQPGAPSRVRGQLALSTQTLDTFGVALPAGYLEGDGAAEIDITIGKGAPPELALRSDLAGLRLRIPPIGWAKSPGTLGRFALDATLSEVPQIHLLSLDAPGLQADGNLTLTEAGQLERIRLDRVRIAPWLDARVDLVGRGPGAPLGLVLRGGTLDLRRLDIPDSGGGARAPLSVALDRLQVTDAIAITDLRGDFTSGAGLDGRFQGRINAGAPVSGQMIPQGGRSAIRLQARDAGAVLASANVVKQVRGGSFELLLQPVGTGGAFDGRLRLRDTSVVDAPAMAALLNAVSIVGLFNAEGGDSLFFTDVNADFRLSPRQITLRQGSAEGPSLGLSMDGVYATDSGALQMQGVITPVYLLNGIGSIFTRPGEGLFAFNYSIGGTVRQPRVSVNPLTALAPGGMRDLFRAPKPAVPRVDGETPAAPEPQPERREPLRGSDR